jgi:fructose-1,6-bisphosphatase II
MGIGGAPEGVLTAAALRCLNGEIQGRLIVKDNEQADRMKQMGIKYPKRVYSTQDLAPAKNIVFAATGVTDGALLKGVRFLGDGVRPHSLVMNRSERKVRFVDTVHLANLPDIKVRF